ncbi:MAG: hypothetical protein KatS3mg023_3867 [Armatimonadota bacterium]|nr:MAG: hypothetical protein KatS3mg023_3867 [Armatimonadota bacterium]
MDLPSWKECDDSQKGQWVERIVQELLRPLWSNVRGGNTMMVPRRFVADVDIIPELRSALKEYQDTDEEFNEWKNNLLDTVDWAPAPPEAPWFYVMTEQDVQREQTIKLLQRWTSEVALTDYLQARNIPPQSVNDLNTLMLLRTLYMAIDLYEWNRMRQRLVIPTPSS